VNPISAYSRYLHRKAAEDPENVYPRANWYMAPWLLVFFAVVPVGAIFHLPTSELIWLAVGTGLVALVGVTAVLVIFIGENTAAARRQPPRYSE
jgi:hypothetical protein